MSYYINPWWFYWARVSSAFKGLATAGAIICAFLAIAVITAICGGGFDEKDKEAAERGFVALLALALLLTLAAVFIPNRDTLIEMQIARLATKEKVADAVDSIKTAVDYVIDAVKSLK